MKKNNCKSGYSVRYSGLDTIIEDRHNLEFIANRHAHLDDVEILTSEMGDARDGHLLHWAK